jgi:hypothetical protein
MAAQLQTTFLKALGDTTMTSHIHRVILENLMLLVISQPRVDPIVKELLSLLDGTKVDGKQKEIVSETIALIIRVKGKVLTAPMQESLA